MLFPLKRCIPQLHEGVPVLPFRVVPVAAVSAEDAALAEIVELALLAARVVTAIAWFWET